MIGEKMLKHKDKLEKNIIDQIKEAQLKLGFVRETVRLYYPMESILGIVEEPVMEPDFLCQQLEGAFPDFAFGIHAGRVEICVPPSYVEYVHKEVETPAFLATLIDQFQKHHHLNVEQIKEIFSGFGDYVCQQMPEGTDFDYVFYFRNPAVDEYYYCIRMEMGHTIYHRFLKSDYEQLLL